MNTGSGGKGRDTNFLCTICGYKANNQKEFDAHLPRIFHQDRAWKPEE